MLKQFSSNNEYSYADGNAKEMIEYVIDEDEFRKIVIRFLPKMSRVHGFREECPKSYKSAFKWYLYYYIVYINKRNFEESYFSPFISDEDSYLPYLVEEMYENYTNGTSLNCKSYYMGWAASWSIEEDKRENDGELELLGYWFYLFNCEGEGCRFHIANEQFEDFYNTIVDFLVECVEHSVPC